MIENALVRGVGFPSDVKITGDNTVEFLDNGPVSIKYRMSRVMSNSV